MNKRFDAAVAEVRMRRAALLGTFSETRDRLSPPRLVDDAVALFDPQRRFLARLADRVARNKLVSLAVLAGAAWLAGAPRRPDGKPPPARKVRRAKPKEKNNDSGQHQRNERPESGTGQHGQEPRTEGAAQAQRVGPRRRSKARAHGGVAPVDLGEPQHRREVGPAGRGTQQQQPHEAVGRQRQPLSGELLTEPRA